MVRLLLLLAFFVEVGESAGVTNVVGAALASPAVCSNLACTLTLGVVGVETPGQTFSTRGFGDVPGPTLRLSAGDTMSVTLVNALQHVDNADDVAMNNFRHPNTTNMHTHGLHVSSDPGSDDIFQEVEPGETGSYSFALPSWHMGGTHWYHPHHHGSTALQAGGGAAGMIIVEDAADEVPPEVAGMTEVLLMLVVLDLALQEAIQEEFNTRLWQVVGDTDDLIMLTNGQPAPTLTVQPGKWYRLRMCYAAIQSAATLELDDDANCQLQLLAKDGVYLPLAPRAITQIQMYPGARADVGLYCTATATTVNLVSNGRRRRLQPGGGGGPGGGGMDDSFTGTALSISVAGADAGQPSSLPDFRVKRPCYSADTQSGTPDHTHEVDLGPPPNINGASFVSSTTYDATFAAGTLVELELTGINGHPFHLHINPYQIVQLDDPDDTTYFQVGDWHDTLFDGGGSATVRFYTDHFAGKMVMHCHVLEHEDEGMMAVFQISGSTGTTYAAAETFDATCFRSAAGRGYTYPNADSWTTPEPTFSHSPTPAPTDAPTPKPTFSHGPTPEPTDAPTPEPTDFQPTADPTAFVATANAALSAQNHHHICITITVASTFALLLLPFLF